MSATCVGQGKGGCRLRQQLGARGAFPNAPSGVWGLCKEEEERDMDSVHWKLQPGPGKRQGLQGTRALLGTCPCSLGSIYGPAMGKVAQISAQGITDCKSGNLRNVLIPALSQVDNVTPS